MTWQRAIAVSPELSSNFAIIVFPPSPLVSSQFFEVAYGSQFDHVMLSFEKHIWLKPEVASSAVSVSVIAVVLEVVLVVTVPEGGVLSSLIPAIFTFVRFMLVDPEMFQALQYSKVLLLPSVVIRG